MKLRPQRKVMKSVVLAVLAVLAVIAVSLASWGGFARISEENAPAAAAQSGFQKPNEVVEIFLKAVNRGELVLFGRTFDKSMLTPIRVEYVYELSNDTVGVKVYSELKEPFPVPNQHCKIRAISAILDSDGGISEIVAHITPDP